MIDELKQRSTGIPGTRAVFVTQMALFRQRGQLLGGTNIEVDVKGHGLDEVRDIAAAIEQQVHTLPGVNFVRSSFEWGNPELQVAVDRQKASGLGSRSAMWGTRRDADRWHTRRHLPRARQRAGPDPDRHRARGGADAGAG